MTQVKYVRFYELMEKENTTLFAKFQDIHDNCIAAPSFPEEFHTVGRRVVEVAQFWERKLCQGMERGKNAQYSQQLSEKFRSLLRKRFSHIDLVGVRIKRA